MKITWRTNVVRGKCERKDLSITLTVASRLSQEGFGE